MKGVFQKNFDFFCQSLQQNQRECKNPPNHSGNVCEKIADFQKPGTQQPEIEDPSAENKNCAIQPDLSPPGPLGPDEQRDGQQHPEQKIQQGAQQRQLHSYPEDAEDVVNQSGAQSQAHRLEKSRPLGSNFRGHPPSSRDKNPPRLRSVSS